MRLMAAVMLSVAGPVLTEYEKRLLEKVNPLGITLFSRNIRNRSQVKHLAEEIYTVIGREDVLIAVDQEGGRVCRLTPPEFDEYAAAAAIGALPSSERQEMSRLHAQLIADDLRSIHFNMNFAPCLDVVYPTTHAVLKSRCFSSDPDVVAQVGVEMVKAYLTAGIIPCVKHLPGHGNVSVDPHLKMPVLSNDAQNFQKDLRPFQAVAALTPAAMTAHIQVPKVDTLPLTLSARGIQEIIRGRIGFQGLLFSDAIEMRALSGSLAERTKQALAAGCDVVSYCGGQEAALSEIASVASPLTEKGMERFGNLKEVLKRQHTVAPSWEQRRRYRILMSQITPPKEDYDAVETLHKMQEGQG